MARPLQTAGRHVVAIEIRHDRAGADCPSSPLLTESDEIHIVDRIRMPLTVFHLLLFPFLLFKSDYRSNWFYAPRIYFGIYFGIVFRRLSRISRVETKVIEKSLVLWCIKPSD